MARIKPQALLIQSKMQKRSTRIGFVTILFSSLLVLLMLSSLIATSRHWSQRSRDQIGTGLSNFEHVDEIADSKKYDLPGYAVLNTSKGYITIELFKDGSPETVDKFLDLCQKGHFKGMPFHHVIKNYVILGGHSQDLGGIEDWTSKRKLHRRLPISPKHEAFMVGTTKIKDGKTFQLFITTTPIADLNEKLTVFGRVCDDLGYEPWAKPSPFGLTGLLILFWPAPPLLELVTCGFTSSDPCPQGSKLGNWPRSTE
ncbi:peptidyl-prolyl cis-trans isomerase CYP21-4-like isoform X2 [Hibiscus syriacus]|uniref:peptidyl-prolyl cis-trans isomerase CYP21-4-like isoform X2 n=1 Tax=Hibiscus syriacus TaxID=106335 RepID=UPI001921D4BC|nr:peptidyl-prolyl cis-trans isomerase CYP21-4-like isoform X2 [Hibiscus syriacus]